MLHASWSARSLADSSGSGVSLRKHPDALNRLLLQRFGGKVGRSLAVQLSRRRDKSTQVKSRVAQVLTGYSGIDESLAEMEDNCQVQTTVCSQAKGVESVYVMRGELVEAESVSQIPLPYLQYGGGISYELLQRVMSRSTTGAGS